MGHRGQKKAVEILTITSKLISIQISFNHDNLCSNEMLLASPIYPAAKSELLCLKVEGGRPNSNPDPMVAPEALPGKP